MKAKLPPETRLQRIRHPFALDEDGHNGAVWLQPPGGRRLNVIFSTGGGWDHVSVSIAADLSTPTWEEMAWIKDMFFDPEECVIQYHPPHSRYVNIDAGTLHLWRPQDEQIPMPPMIYV